MFQQQAASDNFELVHSEDSSVFTAANLATFDVLIMFQTSGMVWTSASQRQAVEGYLASGKGIVAIHNATDMGIENEYPWWDQTINAGAHMPEHSPGVLPGTAIVADKKHPSTASLPDRWNRSEEWYNFDKNPRGEVHVLVTADERTYNPGPRAMGSDHPISWCRNTGGGRVWATAMGHAAASYSETHFRNHVLGGVKWAAATSRATVAAPSGATSRSGPSTATPSTRWRWPWHPTAGCSTSSVTARSRSSSRAPTAR